MMKKHNFKRLEAWIKAKELVPIIYKLVSQYPQDEKYALVSQIKRAVISIPSNIAEGSGRNTNIDFAHFIDMAIGSSFELENDLLISLDLGFIDENELNQMLKKLADVQKYMIGFQNRLRSNNDDK